MVAHPASRVRRAAWVVAVAGAVVPLACSTTKNDFPPPPSNYPPATAPATAPASSQAPGVATTGTVRSAVRPSLTSSAFADGADMPAAHACAQQGGTNAVPPLAWTGFPADAQLVLVVHDPDAPIPGGFTHLVTVIPAGTTSVGPGSAPMEKWRGPCPPSGTHHYVFTLYAFPSAVALPATPDKAAIDAVAPRAVASATLTGLFTHR